MRGTRPLAFCISVLLLGPYEIAAAKDAGEVRWEADNQRGFKRPATIEDILGRDLAHPAVSGQPTAKVEPEAVQPELHSGQANSGGETLDPIPSDEAAASRAGWLETVPRPGSKAARAEQSGLDAAQSTTGAAPTVVTPPATAQPATPPTAQEAAAAQSTPMLQKPPTPQSHPPEPAAHSAPQTATPAPAPVSKPIENAVKALPEAAPAQAAAATAAAATTAAPVQAVPAPAAGPTATATAVPDANKLYLPLKRYFETKTAVALKEFDQADREALVLFYDARLGEPIWVTKTGYNSGADSLIGEMKKADDWGLSAADYKIPALNKPASGDLNEDDLAEAEIKLSLAAMQYGREARGDRIDEPSTQLSSYLDRKPQLIARPKLLEALNAAADKAEYLRSLHPKHAQFERLRQKLIAMRSASAAIEFEKIPDGPKITAGKVHWQIALIRHRLKVAVPAAKPDAPAVDENLYDDALAKAVEEFKTKNDIEPVNPTITQALRKALNKDDRPDERAILANMEQWRWMPADLGSTYINVNIPEFTVRVIKNGSVIHSERVVTGKFETQTPIFSDMMRTVVFQPSWNVPESIKILELLPKLRAGGNPLEGRGLAMKRNGHDVDVWDVDWEKQDIRNFHIYQPPGDSNVLGVVKFLFPNKHSVYLHDTPSKSLFNEKVRTFSHGCMRVRNPVQLAEVIMAEDKGWTKAKINEMIGSGPEDNDVALEKPMPVHVTYFTAWVEDNGELKTFADIYGHEQRIKLGLEGRWNEIVKNRDHLLPPEDAPIARSRDDWGDDDGPPPPRSRPARYTYREEAPQPSYRQQQQQQYYRKKSSFSTFMNSIFGN